MSYEKENLSREKAMILMIEGKNIRHNCLMSGDSYFFYSRGEFFTFDGENNKNHKKHYFLYDYGYYVFEPKPEPRFKEVTMYSPVIKFNQENHCTIADDTYDTIEKAFNQHPNVVGYTEVKVFLKED